MILISLIHIATSIFDLPLRRKKKKKLAAAGSHFLPGLPELWHLGVQSLGSACPRSLDSVMDQTRRPSEGGNGGESLHKGAEVFRVSEIW